MKRLIIVVSILLTASLGLLTAFAETQVVPSPPVPTPNRPDVNTSVEPNKTTPATELRTETDILADPNKIEAAIKSFEGLEAELEELTRKNSGEPRQWIRKEADFLMPLAKANHERILEELMFIRKLTVEEKAAKTTAAIDGIMLNRQQQFEQLMEKYRQEKLETKRDKNMRGRNQTSSQDRRTRSPMP